MTKAFLTRLFIHVGGNFFLSHQIGISDVFTHVSHIPVPARGKDKNEQPHVRTLIRDVIVMLK